MIDPGDARTDETQMCFPDRRTVPGLCFADHSVGWKRAGKEGET